jgi:protein-tyrosine kinase
MSRISEALNKTKGETWREIVPGAATEETVHSVIEGFTNSADEAPAVPPRQPLAPVRLETRTPHGFTFEDALSARLVIAPETNRSAVEQYRRLGTTLHQAQVERGLKVVMIASALSGEGKTLTALNVALTLSASFKRRVLLIDADLRRPTLSGVFGAVGLPGLTEALRADSPKRLQVLEPSACLSVLPGGQPDPNPVSGLSSERMRHIVEDARASFEWVIIDTPPAALLPDVSLLAMLVDGALMVVRAGQTPYAAIQGAIEAIGQQHLLGVVLNGAEPIDLKHYGYYTPHQATADAAGA